jgi:dolichyl-diphosphooligosaccharide--protein glycosyltransferase
MNWLKNNTSEDAIIASWWDYGYWIQTLGERTTIVDNSTLIDWQIKKMAYSLITTPENSWRILSSDNDTVITSSLSSEFLDPTFLDQPEFKLEDDPTCISPNDNIEEYGRHGTSLGPNYCNPIIRGMDADYLLIYVAGERIDIPGSNLFFYTLDGGGDESKKHWFMKISSYEPSKFLEYDGITPTPYFMENSTLGKLIPFSIFKHVDPDTNIAYDEHRDGLIPVYIKDIKYLNSENDPFYLVYASPSFYSEIPGPMSTVLIYKINPNYIP